MILTGSGGSEIDLGRTIGVRQKAVVAGAGGGAPDGNAIDDTTERQFACGQATWAQRRAQVPGRG